MPCPQAGAPDAALKGAAQIGAPGGAPGGPDGRRPAHPRSGPARPGPARSSSLPRAAPAAAAASIAAAAERREAEEEPRGGGEEAVAAAARGWSRRCAGGGRQPVRTRAVASGFLAVTPLSTPACRTGAERRPRCRLGKRAGRAGGASSRVAPGSAVLPSADNPSGVKAIGSSRRCPSASPVEVERERKRCWGRARGSRASSPSRVPPREL